MNPGAESRFMGRALELARQGVGHVAPNPPVGAVAVRDGTIIAEGHHRKFGKAHAERDLIERAATDLRGADLYVSLEPCGHHGKTPPCADAILRAGFGRVVYAVADPNPDTAGVGPATLRAGGVVVEQGPADSEADARWLLAPYLLWVTHARPLVTAKWAMTADGRLATDTGHGRWISSEETRARTLAERGDYDAILVGSATQAADDARLTSRTEGRPDPLRIVVDSELRTDPAARILDGAPESLAWVVGCGTDDDADAERQQRQAALEARGARVWTLPPAPGGGVDLQSLLKLLGEHDVQHLLVEGGGRLQGSFLSASLIDRVQVIVAPKLVAGRSAPRPLAVDGVAKMSQAFELSECRWSRCGPDMFLEGALTPAGRGWPSAPDRTG